MFTCVVGVDPGFSGGVAVLSLAGDIVLTSPMPINKAGRSKKELDVPGFLALIRDVQQNQKIRLVSVERAGSRPGQGRGSICTFCQGFGEILGSIKTLAIPLEIILPQAWKKDVLAGTDWSK